MTDWELWAVAAKVMDAEGDDVGEFLVDRVQALTEAGDHEGVMTWLAIADRVQQLLLGKPSDPKELN
ncbi:hypothetical protein K9B33_20795 [Sphingobium sp. 3R8]|uniref:DUF6961 family protein n=1 Tax=Sphingobium sp. 3R8 TaxID=2874921 RepID=UPI001CC96143|nr:hypothetical protein [Sphingobium sp. 3R8]MBZ9649976.1 hypothetical protein [Sphingobium sp. 3R8]